MTTLLKKSGGLHSDGLLKITESNMFLNLATNILYIIKINNKLNKKYLLKHKFVLLFFRTRNHSGQFEKIY